MSTRIYCGLHIDSLGPGTHQIKVSPGLLYDGQNIYASTTNAILNIPVNKTNIPLLGVVWAQKTSAFLSEIGKGGILVKFRPNAVTLYPNLSSGPLASPNGSLLANSLGEGIDLYTADHEVRTLSNQASLKIEGIEGIVITQPPDHLGYYSPDKVSVHGLAFEIEMGDTTWTDDPALPVWTDPSKIFLGVVYIPPSGVSSQHFDWAIPRSYASPTSIYPLPAIDPTSFKVSETSITEHWKPYQTYLWGQMVRSRNLLAWASRSHVSSNDMMNDIRLGNLTLFNIPMSPTDGNFNVSAVPVPSGVDGSVQYHAGGGVQDGSINLIWSEVLKNMQLKGVLSLDLSPIIPDSEDGQIKLYVTQEDIDGTDHLVLVAKMPNDIETTLAILPIN